MGIGLSLSPVGQALAQTATVTLSSQKQYIRGFGGMVHIPWAGDLTAAERTLAFGNADGQLGFTVLRIAVPDSNTSDSSYVATAKVAIANGGIVYATPWNSSGSMNSSDFATYATHLSSYVSYMKGQGVDLFAIGTQNEPDYGSQGGWKVWTAAQCHDFMLNYGDKVGTKLITCESFNYSKPLFDPTLNDAAAVEKMGVLGTHLYGTAVNNYSYPLFDSKGAGKERWMTEHYTDSTTDANAWPNALGVATEIHNSMVTAQFNAYTWWYIKRSYGPINNGAITKRGWCMAQFSKFIRPGFYRVDATAAPTSGVALSAYKSDTDVVLVAVNTSSSTQSLTVSINGSTISSYDKFTTSSSKNLASDGKVTATNGSLTVSLDGSSVTTLHGSGTITGAGGSTGSGGSTASSGGSTAIGGASGNGGATGTSTSDAGAGRDSGPVGRDSGEVGGPGSGGSQAAGGSSGSSGGSPATVGRVAPRGALGAAAACLAVESLPTAEQTRAGRNRAAVVSPPKVVPRAVVLAAAVLPKPQAVRLPMGAVVPSAAIPRVLLPKRRLLCSLHSVSSSAAGNAEPRSPSRQPLHVAWRAEPGRLLRCSSTEYVEHSPTSRLASGSAALRRARLPQ
jgi:glucuronoarabinoxylan endo-1,4-beta-xylanase